MQLSYFNHLKTIIESNRSKNGYNPLLNESLLDVRQKNASNLSDIQFNTLMKYDPNLYTIQASNDDLKNYPESYMRWLIMMNNKGELKSLSPNNVRESLKKFDIAKKRRNLLPNNDINSYKSIESLNNAIDNISTNLTINQKNKDAKKNQKDLQGEKEPGMYMNGAVELLFNGSKWEVWTPHTFEGSKALRRGADWCTGGDNCSRYDSYSKDGTLYVIINKKDSDIKYQLFVPTKDKSREREFRDANNESLSFRKFCFNNLELQEFFMTQDDINRAYPNLDNSSIDDEWNDDKEAEVADEYGLEYFEDGFYIGISYNNLLIQSIHITPENVQDVAMNGYLEETGVQESLIKKFVQSEYFRNNITWRNTQLYNFYQYFLKSANISKSDATFKDFVSTLFKTNNKDYSETIVYQWLLSKRNNWSDDDIVDVINDYPVNDIVSSWIYEQLVNSGWKPYKIANSDKSYIDKLSYSFVTPVIEDVDTIQDFYENVVDNGQLSYRDYIRKYCFEEDEDDIDFTDIDYESYETDFADDDASSIISLFLSNDEYNKNIGNEEEEENNNDEIDEVLRIAGISL
nr:MAG TPA: hypothetical protein [Caudoviricetes sp.]